MTIKQAFNVKLTENGDLAFKSTGNKYLDILFGTPYFRHNLRKMPHVDNSDYDRLFSMFIRDPRYGLGEKNIGRQLMSESMCSYSEILRAGRADDLFFINFEEIDDFTLFCDFLKEQIEAGNYYIKKWMPRYSSKRRNIAREIAAYWGMNKQQYGHFIKCDTVERTMSEKRFEDIDFSKVPSLASIKYAKAFQKHEPERYKKFLEDVKAGKKNLNVSVTTVYDIYKNMATIDPDIFFDKIEKISGSWIPIVDTSGSMFNSEDCIGKALSIGHYLAKCSSFAPNQVISFSSNPQLITLGEASSDTYKRRVYLCGGVSDSQYKKEITSMYTGDCSNTDFGKVMELLTLVGKEDMPEYLVVLSDMEFDGGSYLKKNQLQTLWKRKGYTTKIIWWNFNNRSITVPEMDEMGNIYLSGYNPMLLKYLQAGFNGEQFLNNLLKEYKKNIG